MMMREQGGGLHSTTPRTVDSAVEASRFRRIVNVRLGQEGDPALETEGMFGGRTLYKCFIPLERIMDSLGMSALRVVCAYYAVVVESSVPVVNIGIIVSESLGDSSPNFEVLDQSTLSNILPDGRVTQNSLSCRANGIFLMSLRQRIPGVRDCYLVLERPTESEDRSGFDLARQQYLPGYPD